MSVDNWTFCPRCERRRQKRLARLAHDVDVAYGKSIEYERKRRALADARNEESAAMFREDYEIGVIGDDFVVEYVGYCTNCRLTVCFTHHKTIEEARA